MVGAAAELIVRFGTPVDFSTYAGAQFPAEWCVDEPIGFVAEQSGDLVAVALLTRDAAGRLWLWYDARAHMPAMVLHRRAKRWLATVRETVHTFPDERIAGADRWLRRLGFQPYRMMAHPNPFRSPRMAWICDLSI